VIALIVTRVNRKTSGLRDERLALFDAWLIGRKQKGRSPNHLCAFVITSRANLKVIALNWWQICTEEHQRSLNNDVDNLFSF